MPDKIKASISALIDEEISELEVHRLLRQFGEQQELEISWIRYLQIRAACQGTHLLTTQQHLDLHSRISLAIADEAVYDGSSVIAGGMTKARSFRTAAGKWYKPVTGLAVAASLVIAVYIGLQSNDGISTGIAGSQPLDTTSQPQTLTPRVSAPVQTAIARLLLPADALKASGSAHVAAVDMPEALRTLSPQAQEKFLQYLRRHELMSRRNFSQNLRTVNFDQVTSPAPRQGAN